MSLVLTFVCVTALFPSFHSTSCANVLLARVIVAVIVSPIESGTLLFERVSVDARGIAGSVTVPEALALPNNDVPKFAFAEIVIVFVPSLPCGIS